MSQQEAESEGVQQHPSNLGGSAHQPDQLPEPESELEISGGSVQPNANLGRSAHQQQSTETQIAHTKIKPEVAAQIAAYKAYIAATEAKIATNKAQIAAYEIESGGVQPNVNPGGSAHHPQLTETQIAYTEIEPEIEPESKPEISGGGVQPNAHLGRSAHQQQLTEAQIAANKAEIAAYEAEIAATKALIAAYEIVSGGVQPNVNPRGSAHQPYYKSNLESDLESEPESEPEIWTAEHLNYYRPLFKAAQSGEWKAAKSFIDSDPNALTAKISIHLGTVLHIAARSRQWKFILMLLELDVSTPQSIEVQNVEGYTALHFVAEGGSLKIAKALLEKNANLLQMVNNEGYLPLASAIFSKNKELVWYLSLNTKVEESPSSPDFIPSLPIILRNLIQAGYHDIALYFVQRFPHLALAKKDGKSLLSWLAENPSYFFSRCNLGIFERWIYKFVRVEIQSAHSLALQSITQGTILGWFKRLLWKAITQLAPSIKIVRDAKMTHECAIQLVNHVVNQIELSTMSFSQILDFLEDPINIAIEGGTEEIVRTLLKDFPDLMFDGKILQAAIKYRQGNIISVLKEISQLTIGALCLVYRGNDTTLHLAANLAPTFNLFSVSGAALQMQRELQWYKAVESVEMYKITLPEKIRELGYNVGDSPSPSPTAKNAFRKEHKELAEKGEKWMKDTGNSCMVVSTLIATVLFATAFTVPGGNVNDTGIPIFLRSKAFTVFAISNALGLFSSLTSLLMFLAILTARYDIEDFLESLPKKLIIGLGSLFFAIVAMIIAFGAALTIILSERWHWVSVPISLLASFPVAMFVKLQLPLFVQMVRSTYGASIFRP